MPTVIVYSKADCGPCTTLKNLLMSKGVEFREARVDLEPAALAYVKEDLGFMSVPVLEIQGIVALCNPSPASAESLLQKLNLIK